MKRSTGLLLALAAVVTWAAARAWLGPVGPLAPTEGGGRSERGASGRKGKLVEADDVPVVVTELSRAGAREAFQRERSLFDYAKSPEELKQEQEARRAAEAEARRRAEEASAAAAKRAEEEAKRLAEQRRRDEEERQRQAEYLRLNPPKPVPPSFPYQYVGTIGPMDDPFAILSGADREYRFFRSGETIDDKFLLEYIGEARLDLSYTDPRFADQFAQVQRSFDTASRTR